MPHSATCVSLKVDDVFCHHLIITLHVGYTCIPRVVNDVEFRELFVVVIELVMNVFSLNPMARLNTYKLSRFNVCQGKAHSFETRLEIQVALIPRWASRCDVLTMSEEPR